MPASLTIHSDGLQVLSSSGNLLVLSQHTTVIDPPLQVLSTTCPVLENILVEDHLGSTPEVVLVAWAPEVVLESSTPALVPFVPTKPQLPLQALINVPVQVHSAAPQGKAGRSSNAGLPVTHQLHSRKCGRWLRKWGKENTALNCIHNTLTDPVQIWKKWH